MPESMKDYLDGTFAGATTEAPDTARQPRPRESLYTRIHTLESALRCLISDAEWHLDKDSDLSREYLERGVGAARKVVER